MSPGRACIFYPCPTMHRWGHDAPREGTRSRGQAATLASRAEKPPARVPYTSAGGAGVCEAGLCVPVRAQAAMVCAAVMQLAASQAAGSGWPAAAPPVSLPPLCGSLPRTRVRSSARLSRAAPASSRSSTAVAATVSSATSPPVSNSKTGEFQSWTSPFANKHRRTDIKRIMILGAGPIIIGQAGF